MLSIKLLIHIYYIGITIKSFISRLTHYLASPIDPEYKKKMNNNDNNLNFVEYFPRRPFGFGMNENEVRPLLRSYRYGGLLECLGKNLLNDYFI
jgi:hypothetical protein